MEAGRHRPEGEVSSWARERPALGPWCSGGALRHFAWTWLVKCTLSTGCWDCGRTRFPSCCRRWPRGVGDCGPPLLSPGFHLPFRKPQRKGILQQTQWRSLDLSCCMVPRFRYIPLASSGASRKESLTLLCSLAYTKSAFPLGTTRQPVPSPPRHQMCQASF